MNNFLYAVQASSLNNEVNTDAQSRAIGAYQNWLNDKSVNGESSQQCAQVALISAVTHLTIRASHFLEVTTADVLQLAEQLYVICMD